VNKKNGKQGKARSREGKNELVTLAHDKQVSTPIFELSRSTCSTCSACSTELDDEAKSLVAYDK
jgi:hypothetical protein